MKEGDAYRRRSPEVLLKLIEEMRRGRLCILVAVASGAGKTTQLIHEGELRAKEGLDVVWGTSVPEQDAAAASMEAVAAIRWARGHLQLEDLDVARLCERAPDIVLVDGLAQPNRPEAERQRRLDDVRFLLQHGISVIATMNAYEDERVSEQARRIAGVDPKWTLPAEVLQAADEVRLLDVTAETLIERRQVHAQQERVSFAATNKKAHSKRVSERSRLSILRELALRTIANDVNGSLEQHRHELGLEGPSGVTERILVLAQYGWNGSIHVRRGEQVAKRLNGELFILSFVDPNLPLTQLQLTFQRSLKKLVQKIGASWEEVPLSSRRRIAGLLSQYAWTHSMTRIVLGHSRQSRWQEWIHGSLVNGLLRTVEHTDLFFVADRSEREGERVFPVKTEQRLPVQAFKRWTAGELEERADGLRRGHFKIIIGAAPGVGKTYKMLQEGNRLLEQGVDVVIGLLETHGRRETAAQVGALPWIERQKIKYQGHLLEEMNTAEILARKPELVLVDELAHTNVPGSVHTKRYEDVIQLLEAGISVMSTVNVQHIESLNDAVEHLTGVRVRETVPDGVLRLADEMELIDVTPSTIQKRMQDGLIYAKDKVDQALSNFFRIPNLIGLRELALREVADDVDERLESWERRALLRGPWRRKEVIFVCVEPDERAERLVRHGFRIAHRLKAELYVVCLPVANLLPSRGGKNTTNQPFLKWSEQTEALTVRLGGTFCVQASVQRRQWAQEAVRLADEHKASQMIVGVPARRMRKSHMGRMRMLMRIARHMDVLVVTDNERERV
ncbi:universal stress protein [Paenibacillus agilis]|uniref:Histidine kinase n=1 Tax=Paenibacillus agilis TaxID=3020863 RepID=A0A559IHM3_9BACL|nr:universal stress protein [Paenibacillus agilis]TVX87185.1 histidine kinase [Paenibacillus agilis]